MKPQPPLKIFLVDSWVLNPPTKMDCNTSSYFAWLAPGSKSCSNSFAACALTSLARSKPRAEGQLWGEVLALGHLSICPSQRRLIRSARLVGEGARRKMWSGQAPKTKKTQTKTGQNRSKRSPWWWMKEWMNERTSKQLNERTNEKSNEWMKTWMKKWMQ